MFFRRSATFSLRGRLSVSVVQSDLQLFTDTRPDESTLL